jgi:hypothetical protein
VTVSTASTACIKRAPECARIKPPAFRYQGIARAKRPPSHAKKVTPTARILTRAPLGYRPTVNRRRGPAAAAIVSNVLKGITKSWSMWGHHRHRLGPHPRQSPSFATRTCGHCFKGPSSVPIDKPSRNDNSRASSNCWRSVMSSCSRDAWRRLVNLQCCLLLVPHILADGLAFALHMPGHQQSKFVS